MSQFTDREKAFEAKFGHDQEMHFRAVTRRNKLLGLWAAEQLDLTGADAEAYAKSVIEADFEHVGHEDVVQKVLTDLSARGLDVTDHIIRKKMEELLGEAMTQLMVEVPAD